MKSRVPVGDTVELAVAKSEGTKKTKKSPESQPLGFGEVDHLCPHFEQ